MAKQRGVVLVFKPEVTQAQAQAAVAELAAKGLLDVGYYCGGVPHINEFNPDHGGPVWYVP